MLGTNKGKKLDQYVTDYVVFDLETTGISCYNDQVVEISAVKVSKGAGGGGVYFSGQPQVPNPLQGKYGERDYR